MKKIKIYLAGGWFNAAQKETLDFLENELDKRANLQIYSPRREIMIETGTIADKEFRQKVFNLNIDNIDDADLVIASTEGKDMGTIFESGYSFATGKKIVYVYFVEEDKGFNLMLSESSTSVLLNKNQFLDFISDLNKHGMTEEVLKKYEYHGVIQ